MRVRILIILSIAFYALVACKVSVDTVSLENNYMTSIHPGEKVSAEDEIVVTGKPVLSYNNGNLLENLNWWSLQGIEFEQTDDAVVFEFDNIGPSYTPFGADLPLLDFEKEDVVIKITARAESKGGDVPVLSMQLDDSEGVQANGRRPEARIGNTDEYTDYYFDCSDIWIQTYPDKKDVNASIINKVLFFVNPGNTGYTGKIFIQDIQALPIDSIQENQEFKIPVGKEGGVVSSFNSQDLDDWWASEKYSLSWNSDSTLKISCSQVGPDYGSFSVKLPETMDMSMAYKLVLKARYEGEGYPELRVDVQDYKGYLSPDCHSTNTPYNPVHLPAIPDTLLL
ncbi:MAG: hypothetical protein R6U95_10075, partial [Bacteroidales bacterium]